MSAIPRDSVTFCAHREKSGVNAKNTPPGSRLHGWDSQPRHALDDILVEFSWDLKYYSRLAIVPAMGILLKTYGHHQLG